MYLLSYIFSVFILNLTLIPKVFPYMNRCFKNDDLRILWTKHIGQQFISSLTIDDLTPNTGLEILAQVQNGDLAVLSAKSGEFLYYTAWPVKSDIKSSHSSPLLYDVNNDGVRDVLTISTEGEISVHDIYGKPIIQYKYDLNNIYIKRDWYKQVKPPIKHVSDFKTMNGFIMTEKGKDHIKLNPHVFATGVIEDINNDKVLEELVLPVTYMVENRETFDPESNIDDTQNLPIYNINDYLVSAVVVFNLTSFTEISRFFTELDKKTSDYPPYALTSPMVVSYMHKISEPQIMLATAGGKITQLNYQGHEVQPPIITEGITEQFIVEDITFYEKDRLEFVYADKQGHVVCVDSANELVWDTDVKGNVTGIRLFERKTVDGTLVKILVVATFNGKIWLLDGRDGKALSKWPMKVGKSLHSPPNILQIVHHGLLYIGHVDSDGYLHMISIDQACKYNLYIGETTKVGFVVHDLDPDIPGLEFLIATTHGSIIAVGLNVEKQKSGNLLEHGVTNDMFNTSFLSLYAWPSEGRSHNVYIHSGNTGCFITNIIGQTDGYTTLDFTLLDFSRDASNPSLCSRGKWNAMVVVGNKIVTEIMTFKPQDNHISKGIHTSRDVAIGSHTVHFHAEKLSDFLHIEVRCYQHYGQLYSHTVAYKVQQSWSTDILILFMLPIAFMFVLFIVEHLVNFKSSILVDNHHYD